MSRPEVAIPDRMRHLPLDKHGRPTPWFAARDDDGVPDFRVIRPGGIQDAMRFKWCWVCGKHRGANAAFVIGPMCAVNRTSGEPPAHLDCAVYSAKACPFLSNPNMTRRTRGLPEESVTNEFAIDRNPGVALVWVTRDWHMYPDPNGMPLFAIGEPDQVYWYAHGRDATRAEVLESIDSGMPTLRNMAVLDGDQALEELSALYTRALDLVPAA
jgi:hypothetical protein